MLVPGQAHSRQRDLVISLGSFNCTESKPSLWSCFNEQVYMRACFSGICLNIKVLIFMWCLHEHRLYFSLGSRPPGRGERGTHAAVDYIRSKFNPHMQRDIHIFFPSPPFRQLNTLDRGCRKKL